MRSGNAMPFLFAIVILFLKTMSMDSLPRISIVTPSFNDAKYIEETILSVIGQGYGNLEYIVIDGGSTDGTVDVIRKYANHLAYWVSEKDRGMYHAIEKGFKLSSGTIMGWINSDDRLHHGSLFTLAQIFSDFQEIQWLQGFPNSIDESGRIVSVRPGEELDKCYFLSNRRDKTRYIQQESTYWRRSLWDRAGGYISTHYKYAGDFELWLRFFQFAKLYNVNAFIGSFRLTSGDQASLDNFADYVKETVQIVQDFPVTASDKEVLNWMTFSKRVNSRVKATLELLRKWRGINVPGDTVNHALTFDPRSQKFVAKRRR